MSFSDAYALGPLDGRYRPEVAPLIDHLSEQALNRTRAHVEVEWLIFLSTHQVLPGAPLLTDAEIAYLRAIPTSMDDADIARLAAIEAQTRHDVKAVEYFLKEKLDAAPASLEQTNLPQMHEIVHIFATSEDINNLAYALNVKAAVEEIWLPAARGLTAALSEMARANAATPLLSHTHGQPASPSTLGKEIAVLAHRLNRQIARIESAQFLGKFNGATGTYGAHSVSVPDADWPALARQFVEGLGLTFNPLTTQIESHDWMSELFADVARFNRIAHNLATDFWTYISLGYLAQNLAAQGSTGSSTMPHKVNPIRFENAEANFEISCALLDTLAATLVTSRLQRDLTDSSTLRNIGVAFGHSLLALTNLRRGVAGVEANRAALEADLDSHWEVLGEPIQQAMRTASIAGATGMQDPYERLKELTRGHQVGATQMRAFIDSLGLPDDVAARLRNLTPGSYVGLAADLVR
ncbi:adenylosuccinate lyase [Trueperella pyogenes]|uniref:adenylosuccinate lyase n=1 Tax=Trueperella pyogenes TaxID=1661 RepID=UPI00215D43B4|nr:adenylosuccinate lyase [Trueperella pyogenes]UVJ59593.1 adenylosuccinate lyase [Trueperella pyogenes]